MIASRYSMQKEVNISENKIINGKLALLIFFIYCFEIVWAVYAIGKSLLETAFVRPVLPNIIVDLTS
jgi:hypothetical protein